MHARVVKVEKIGAVRFVEVVVAFEEWSAGGYNHGAEEGGGAGLRVEAEVGKSDVPEIGGDDANLMRSAVSQMIMRIQRANLDIIFTDMPCAPERFQIEEIEEDGEDFPDARGSKAVEKRSKLSPAQADSQPLQFPHLFSQGRLLLVTCTYL